MCGIDVLRQVQLFADLSEKEFAELAGRLRRRVFAGDVIIFHKDSPAQSLYLLESGAVRIFALSETGQEITLEIYGPGECFGETALLDGNLRSTGAMTVERTVIYTLCGADFRRCLEQYPQVARRLMGLLAHRLDHVTAYAENLVFLDVPGRVATRLLALAEHCDVQGGSLPLSPHLTQSELATWCACSREMVNKVLRMYQDQGLIALDGHDITIRDMAGLKARIAG